MMGRNKSAVLLGLLIILTACAQKTPVPQTLPSTSPVVVRQSGGAGLLIAQCQDRQYITGVADYIVEGTVEKVESKWNEDKSAIFTYTNLSIEKYVKGKPFSQDKLQIVTPGGTVGDISQVVEDQPILHEGRRIRIYFQEIDGEFYIVCTRSGVEEL